MSDNPQVKIEVAEGEKPERCANCDYFSRASSAGMILQLFVMGWCVLQNVDVLPEAVCKWFKAVE